MHHYPGYGPGGPLAAFWQRRISLRLLRVMVEHLPPSGATARAYNSHAWQPLDFAAADTRDLLNLLLTAFVNAHRDPKKPAVPWPEPGWRPGDPTPEESAAKSEEQQARARAAYQHILARAKGE
ncbi:hypothetical protein [Streptomyces swartbergensis]|uniref:Uncharacterized protein n=1 Tax=Streptomyces swartbergensis TaxID=487165 RepID=A0A243S4U2_9ACTN|nr:hypothetical protein [Streptomyces swartbergensis]OUD02572.1 hypothetical protein CA983_14195 [Streptomyces swartbergensis]